MLCLFKKVTALLCAIVVTFCVFPVLAAADSPCPNVIDYLLLLSEDEVLDLQASIEAIRVKHDMDVAIVITDDTQGKSSKEYADDFYDENGYGMGIDATGLLMLINMDAYEIWISTNGQAIDLFDHERLEAMLDNIIPFASDDQHYLACKIFLNDVDEYGMQGLSEPESYNQQNTATVPVYPNVADYLGFFSNDDLASLQGRIDAIRDEHGIDAVIVITDDTQGKSSRDFADDYYDYNGYGVGADASGILLLINMGDRVVWISTAGRAIDIFTDQRIETIIDNLFEDVKNARYYAAGVSFLNDVDRYCRQGVSAGQYRYDESDSDYLFKVRTLLGHPFVYIIPLAIALIITLILSSGRKGKVTISNTTYEDQGSFQLTGQTDAFIRKTVTSTKISSDSGSGFGGGGRSSTHSGSSGRSHGGGGRSF